MKRISFFNLNNPGHIRLYSNNGLLPNQVTIVPGWRSPTQKILLLDLTNLQVLELSYASKLPPWALLTSWFTKLKNLFMTESNLIEEILESIGNLTALEFLDLSSNTLSGEIPDSVFLLKNLTQSYLYNNTHSGPVLPSIEALNMEKLDLSMNDLLI